MFFEASNFMGVKLKNLQEFVQDLPNKRFVFGQGIG